VWQGQAVQFPGQVVRQHVGKNRAEYGSAERATDRAEKGRAGRGRAEVGVLHRVLHRDDQDLHRGADPGTEHQHVQRGEQRPGGHGEQRQQVQPEGHDRGADDREDLVPAAAADQLPGPGWSRT
jgi:hypothetical protein